jgi:Ca2+-binding RTX toxin-like protein
MPKFTVGDGFFANFFGVPLATANGDFVTADAHLIRIRTEAGEGRPAGFENYIGDFTYTDAGLPLGRIDEYRFVTLADAPVYDIADANLSVLGLRKAAQSGDPQAFLRLIFRADDVLIGGSLGDTMRAFAGNDGLKGKAGDDWLGGMSGSDVVRGNAGDDEIHGGGGRDKLHGGSGDDMLDGGTGRNRLTGGAGDDTFVFTVPGKPNRITDFGKGDLIALGFSGLGPDGPLDPAAFHRGALANGPGPTILYDEDTGWLLYARKGSETADPSAFAKVGKHIGHIGAEDFVVI